MNKQESLALYEKGKEAWNIWANEMLAKKAELKKGGQWQIDIIFKKGLNPATADWIVKSSVDFSEHLFEGDIDFSRFIFPWCANYNNAEFSGEAKFIEVTFSDNVWFKNARFCRATEFMYTKFRGNAEFSETTFCGNVQFNDTTFSGNARFQQTLFESFTSFKKTIFKKTSFFVAINAKKFFTFKDAEFHLVPDFTQAHFTEAPQFDDSDFTKALEHRQSNDRENLSSRWRSLKRLAIQGHDHERELIFFAEEIKSQRGKQDKAFPCPLNYFDKKPIWQGGTRYWFGYLYQYLSDFGRSIMRPIFWLLISSALFYIFYLQYPIEDKLTCTHEDPITQVNISCKRSDAAIYLSARSTLLFLPVSSYSEKINRSYECLYGKNSEGKANIPNVAVFFSITQTILSTILIFLLLLALRNHFRIK